MTDQTASRPTGYGPRSRLAFSGEEEEYDLWEVRFLGYMAIQDLKKTLLEADPDVSKNEKAYAELVMLLDEKSLALVMHDAADDGQKALKILREHYKGTSKPRILTLYTNLCNLKLSSSDGLTEYVSRAELTRTRHESENCRRRCISVSDSLLIVMVMKGLPQSYNNFVTVVTQSSKVYTFSEFKAAVRNFAENEKSQYANFSSTASNSTSSDRVMKLKEFTSKKTTVKGYGCKQEGHYARKCPNLYCTNCKMKGHSLEKCRKKDNAKSCVQSASGDKPDHVSYAFRAGGTIHKDMGLLVDTGASSHIVRDPAMFSSFNDKFDTQRHSIELANGTQSKAAKERGTAHIAIMDANGRTHNAILVMLSMCPTTRVTYSQLL